MKRILNVIVLTGLCHLAFCTSQYQYVLFQTEKTWKEAQSYCRDKCVDLASFQYMEEMKEVLTFLEGKYDDAVWFGLVKGETMNWHWSMTGSGFYKEGERDYVTWGEKLIYNCGVADNSSTVYARPCNKGLYSVCFDATKKGEDQYILHAEKLSWTEALDYCRNHYSDLTSVRNTDEYNVILKIATGNSVWIGFFRDPWTWSDLSSSSLRYWKKGKEVWTKDAENCGALLKNESGRWGTRECSETHPFICSCIVPEISRRLIKVKINLQDSTLDLNDAAVQDSILEQLKMKMDGTGGEKLRWKKHPDGKVFVKQTP